MKKVLVFPLFSFFLFVLFAGLPKPLLAQTTTPNPTPTTESGNISQSWQCLKVKKVRDHMEDYLKLEIQADDKYLFFPPETEVYIIDCFSTGGNSSSCTTGIDSVDTFLGLNGPPKGYVIRHSFSQPIKSDVNGRLTGEPFTWTTYGSTEDMPDQVFYGLSFPQDVTYTSNTAVLKLATWYPQNSDTNCKAIRWDPKGIVFDSKSLEPINGVTVSILDQNGKLFSKPGFENPKRTGENGQYTFFVESNYYSLKAAFQKYKFPSVVDPLPFQTDPNFPYINIYRGEVFFEPPEELLEKNIPVDPPAGSTPYKRDAKLTDWTVEAIRPSDQVRYHGGVIHPKSTILLRNGNNVIGQTTANSYGRFELYVDNSLIDATLPLVLEAIKPEIMTRTTLLPKNTPLALILDNVFSPIYAIQNSSATPVEPVLNYLEGYAYDANNQVVPNATVEIYPNFATKPFYRTKADANGFFKIYSQNLPPFPYSLKIISETGLVSTLTTAQFAIANKNYTNQTKTNYGVFNPSPDVTLNPTRPPSDLETTEKDGGKFSQDNTLSPKKSQDNKTPAEKTQEARKQLYLLVVFTALVLAGGIYYVRRKMNKQTKINLP